MAIIFSQNTRIEAAGTTSINIPGSVIQFVDNTSTVSTTAGTGAWVTVLTTSITTSGPSRILVEYMMNERMDFAQGNWNLIYHRILRGGGIIMQSGHNGSRALHIGFYERSFIHQVPGAGTHTFIAQCLAYQGTAWLGSFNSGSTNHYLRLYELAQGT